MNITQYAAKPESYNRLSTAQIWNFFQEIQGTTQDECNRSAANFLKTHSPVSPTAVQGATSYTVAADGASKVIQFRTTELDVELIELARKSYPDFVPKCEVHGKLGSTWVYAWDLVSGSAFCRVRRKLLAPGMEQRLQKTVQDFARFFASAWISRPAFKQPSDLFEDYSQRLDTYFERLPERFYPKLKEIRQGLPLLFRPEYPMAVQHDDLLENNIHVDEATGRITGIVDWQDAITAPFGVSLGGLETILGVQTKDMWHLHNSHVDLRKQFWICFYEEIGQVSEDDLRSINVARLFGLFRSHSLEENAAAYLDALCWL